MNFKEKQIEEMARIICKPTANKGNCEKCGFKKHCSKFDDATDLYNAGYRKQSEVIDEFITMFENAFSELQEFFNEDTYENLVASNDALNLLDKIAKQMKGGEQE